jgi:solute carrier family 35 protein
MKSSDVENLVGDEETESNKKLHLMRILSALFYAFSSFLITVVNKVVLTSCRFPSSTILALGQIVTIIFVLFFAKKFGLVSYPNFARDSFRKIFPLPFLYLGNAVTGLGGTKELSLPMFTASRRFSILFTMILEFYILGVRPGLAVQFSVYTMIGGALLASTNDVKFSVPGYALVMLNNVFTASNGVFMKKKLESKEYGKYGLMFYNALFMVFPLIIFAHLNGDFEKAMAYPHWNSGYFLVNFILSCLMGFILNISVVLCTLYNSALTTSIIGCLKNISVTYLGMFIGGDYIFQLYNFIGINISVAGSLLYTYVTFKK